MINLTINQKIVIGIICVILISVIGIYIWRQSNQTDYSELDDIEMMRNITNDTNSIDTEISKQEKTNTIIVHITGCVMNQGIVKISEGSRISDAIDSAGGLSKDADMSRVNLAYMIEDGQKIYIPSIHDKIEEDTKEKIQKEYVSSDAGDNVILETNTSTKNTGEGEKILVNINTATQTELESLPGIGPSTAIKIIEYRNTNGKFGSIEDITNVNGIGNAKFENIKDNITI